MRSVRHRSTSCDPLQSRRKCDHFNREGNVLQNRIRMLPLRKGAPRVLDGHRTRYRAATGLHHRPAPIPRLSAPDRTEQALKGDTCGREYDNRFECTDRGGIFDFSATNHCHHDNVPEARVDLALHRWMQMDQEQWTF